MGKGEAAHPEASWRPCTCLVPLQCPQACMCQACLAGVGGAEAFISNSNPAPSLPQGRRWTSPEANAAPPTPCP